MFLNSSKNGNNTNLSDEDVVRLILDGQEQLREELYTRYSNKIYYKCISITKDREGSKDLTHDIIFKIFINLSKFQGKSNFSFWVNSITYNGCMDFLDKRKKQNYEEVGDDKLNVADDEDEFNSKILKDNNLVRMEKAMEMLTQEERLILMMSYFDNMSIRDISTSLNIGESASKMRLKRARESLTKKMDKI
jgi:RNA polymerase sigma factor (sigma-70 family)